MRIVVAIAIILASAAPARAEDPWAKGVPAETQKKANALFAEANQLFAKQAHPAALVKYEQAIALWDHPLIRFNMAVTLVRLDRLIEAADALEQALRFGAAPFPAELYQQALDYKKLVGGRVGTIEASCTQKDAHVLLDGKRWFTCPRTERMRVTAGEHTLVGERDGFITLSRRVVVAGGATAKEKLELLPIDAAVKFEYPVSRWVPWAIVGAGAAIGFGGLGVYFVGQGELDQFRDDYEMRCPLGCREDLSDVPDLKRDLDGAELKGTIAISMMAAGGAITVTGIIWGGFINRPRRVVPKLEVAPTSGGATARVRWQF